MVVIKLPTRVVKSTDWAAACDLLEESDEPLVFAIKEYDSRILYQYMYRRGYRISCHAVDGGMEVTKGPKVVKTKKEKHDE